MNMDNLVEKCNDLIGEYTSFPDDVLYEALSELGYDSDKRKSLEIREVLNEETGERRRWSYEMQSVWKVGDSYISFWWNQPASEMQEGQPTDMACGEVEKEVKMVEKIIYK